MPRPLLLIVDGESLRNPSLVSALEVDGWAVRFLRSGEARAFLDSGEEPVLLLLDASVSGEPGIAFARSLRARSGRLPILMLSEGSEAAVGAQEPPLEVQGFLDRTLPEAGIAAVLRRHRPEGPKLTTEDIFGDLLEELEAPPSVSPRPTAPSPAKVPPMPAAESSSALPPVKADPLSSSEFTLSGIPGVNDPFDWSDPKQGAEPQESPNRPAPQASSQPPEAIEEYGNYFLLEKIAVGGMAELFKAQQRGVQGFQKIVAIKRILPHYSDNDDFVTMFIDEAKLAAQLTHPNIVQIFDLGKAGTSYYIAMEYVNGRDLRTLLRKVREYGLPFPEQVAAFVGMKVAAALDYAHRKRGFDDRELKLVHRDISPQNVILSTEGAVKLVDFGIAKAASKASHTMAGALKGKLLYMSPEQASGQPLDNRSDLYSLGLVLFELLTGERCFQADSELGVLEKVRLGRITDLATLNPNVSRDMVAIVSRALQRGVDLRYPSARFMERDLREYLQRQSPPITEHDVAEYMQVLLGGSREQLEALVSARFSAPAAPAGRGESAGTEARVSPGPDASLEPEREPSRGPAGRKPGSVRPRWLLPLILGIAVILVIILAVAGRS